MEKSKSNYLFLPLIVQFLALTLVLVLISMKSALAVERIGSNTVDICEGRYAKPAEMVDAVLGKYGTLYSGGNHHAHLDDVGATIDLYRLWRGLPDWHLRDLDVELDWWDEEDKGALTANYAWLINSSEQPPFDEKSQRAAIVALDLQGRATNPADLWLSDEQYQNASSLTMWLQFALAASDVPWANFPAVTSSGSMMSVEGISPNLAIDPSLKKLTDLAWSNYQKGEGIEWAVTAQLLYTQMYAAPELESQFEAWQNQVFTCEATPAIYAAWSVVAPYRISAAEKLADKERVQFYSKNLKEFIVRYSARAEVLWSLAERQSELYPRLKLYAQYQGRTNQFLKMQLVENRDLRSWIAAGFSFVHIPSKADTLESEKLASVLELNRGLVLHQFTMDRFNLLTQSDLLELTKHGEFSVDTDCAILSTVYARYVAQGRGKEAFELLPEVLALYPVEHQQKIEGLLSNDLPLAIKNAVIVLYTPLISTQIANAHQSQSYNEPALNRACSAMVDDELVADHALKRDLPFAIINKQRFLENQYAWLSSLNSNYQVWSPSWGHPQENYSTRSRRNMPRSYDVGHGRYYPQLPRLEAEAANTAAHLTAYYPHHGLTHVVSVNIIQWVESLHAKKSRFNAEEKNRNAELLRRVIRMNRYNSGGTINGEPVGKRAHVLLQQYYPDTEAAKNTPYWYEAPEWSMY